MGMQYACIYIYVHLPGTIMVILAICCSVGGGDSIMVFKQVRTVPLCVGCALLNVAVDTSHGLTDTSFSTKSQTVSISFTLELVTKEWKQSSHFHRRSPVKVVQVT